MGDLITPTELMYQELAALSQRNLQLEKQVKNLSKMVVTLSTAVSIHIQTKATLRQEQKVWECEKAEQQLQQSQQFLNMVINSTSDPIFVKNEQHKWVLMNDALCKFIGCCRADLMGKSDHDFFTKEEADVFWATDNEVLSTGIESINEECIIDLDGNLRYILTKKTCFQDPTNNKFIVGTIRDITELKQAEHSLKETKEKLEIKVEERTVELQQVICQLQREVRDREIAEAGISVQKQRLALVIEQSPLGVIEWGSQLQAITWNKAAEIIFGYSQNDVASCNGYCLLLPDKNHSQIDLIAAPLSVSTGEFGSIKKNITKDGRIIICEWHNRPLFDAKENIIGIVSIVQDITERQKLEDNRKQAEAVIREQEQFLRSIYEGVKHLIFSVDVTEEGDFFHVGFNPSTERATGLTTADILGKTPDEVHGPKQGAKVIQRYNDCLQMGTSITYEECLMWKGQETWWLTTLNPLRDQLDRIYRLVGTTFSITELKQAEQALRQSENELRQKANDLEYALQELRQTQSRLVQTEKMSSLGQLVAGVAHEINNPVNFIYGNLSHASEYTQNLLSLLHLYQQHFPNPPLVIREEADEIDLDFLIKDFPKIVSSMRMGAERIQKIVASLRNFSRMDEAEFKEVDIHEGIDSTLMILKNRLKARSDRLEIQVSKQYSALPLIECYPGQLNQVFMNLLSNAIDALEEKILTQGQAFNTIGSKITIHTGLLNPERVIMRFIDNGFGIPEKSRQRLFDPFFTTKPVGKGTGMGLSISYQIITERHNGSLYCLSTPGHGAEFVIEIPVRQGFNKT